MKNENRETERKRSYIYIRVKKHTKYIKNQTGCSIKPRQEFRKGDGEKVAVALTFTLEQRQYRHAISLLVEESEEATERSRKIGMVIERGRRSFFSCCCELYFSVQILEEIKKGW